MSNRKNKLYIDIKHKSMIKFHTFIIFAQMYNKNINSRYNN